MLVFMYSTRCFCPNLMKIQFSGQIFEKYLYKNFPEDQSSGSRVVHEDRRMDGWTDVRQT